MPMYHTRCDKTLLQEVVDRGFPLGTAVECSSCMTNRLYSERALVERAKREIRGAKELGATRSSLSEILNVYTTLLQEFPLIAQVEIKAGKQPRDNDRPTDDPQEWTLLVRYFTREQAIMFAEEREAIGT